VSPVSPASLIARSDRSVLTEWRRTVDWGLLGGAFFLIAIGLLMSLAAGPTASARIGYDDPYFFTVRQAAFAALSVIIMLATSLLGQVWARRLAGAVFVGAFGLMLLILVFGHEAKGAQRWLRIAGFSLQPSELIKPCLIVLCGWLLAQRERFPGGPWAPIAFFIYAATLGLLLLQPDVGQAALITAAFVVTFYVSGLPIRWAALFGLGGTVLATVLYAALPHVQSRVHAFFGVTGVDTYQIDTAAEAIGRGGLFGVGPGEGLVKAKLPDAHTDFIFAVLAEEFGLVAAIVLLTIFTLMILRGFRAAAQVDDPYPRAAAAGLFTLFGLQAAINLAVNLALIPPKGMTLPFVSSGGSSLIGIGLTLGLALALVRGQGTRTRGRYG
jgi:cell division protein FtsW